MGRLGKNWNMEPVLLYRQCARSRARIKLLLMLVMIIVDSVNVFSEVWELAEWEIYAKLHKRRKAYRAAHIPYSSEKTTLIESCGNSMQRNVSILLFSAIHRPKSWQEAQVLEKRRFNFIGLAYSPPEHTPASSYAAERCCEGAHCWIRAQKTDFRENVSWFAATKKRGIR